MAAMQEKGGAVDLAEVVGRLSASKAKWVATPPARKAQLLVEMLRIFATCDHEAWARESLNAEGYDVVVPDSSVAVQLILNTRVIGKDLETLVDIFCTLRDTGSPPPVPTREQPDGTVVADVFPRAFADSKGPDRDWKVEVWAKGPEACKQGAPPAAPDKARVGLLLGAGNQGILVFCDALHMLFVENMTCVVKHNPVRAYNHAWMEKIFAPLIDEGVFASVLGGIDESKALIADPRVDHVHMTGGKATHDAIVWGSPKADGQRKDNKLGKPITSELGTISPWVMGPGEWTDQELKHHAAYFTTVLMNNNGCNCMAPQVLLLPASGFPTGKFMAMLKAMVKARPHAPPYYPGTRPRYEAWVEALKADPSLATTEFLESNVKMPPSRKFGPPLPWAFSTVDFAALGSGKLDIVTQVEAFGPTLAIATVPNDSNDSFWRQTTGLCNEALFGSLSATLVMHPSNIDEQIIRDLKYGSVGVNSWGGQSFGYNSGSWGAYPGETLEAVESGIGQVRNYLFLQGIEKSVVRAPFMSVAHIGTAGKPPDLQNAKWLAGIFSNGYSTARHNNGPNNYLTGNFLPCEGESVQASPKVVGTIPSDLRGCFIRNGVNQRYEPNGKMHMFDGDAMLHAFVFGDGKCTSYANSWIRTPRFIANENAGRDIWATFGDLTVKPGLETAKKFGWIALQQRAGMMPFIPPTRAQNPSTATQLIAGKLYACVEVNAPFRLMVNPKTGQVTSYEHDDFGGKLPVFSAHSKVDSSGNVVFFAKGARSPDARQTATNRFGVIGSDGQIKQQVSFLCGPGAPPAFLHDYFVTESWAICVDHSLRADPSKMTTTGYFDWDASRNLRLGLLPRDANGEGVEPEWYDLGMPGFVWHCVGSSQDGDRVTCWMPIFEDDYSEVPIHLASEPHSFLYKIVINTATKAVEELKKFEEIGPTERCAINDDYIGEKEPQFGYLMMRGPEEMYDGFVKFDLKSETVLAKVPYGEGRFGGEAFFQPREGATDEDDGWLMDIVYDKNNDTSELCIWDARNLESAEPIAIVKSPHRIPYGVHGLFLTPSELQRQAVPPAPPQAEKPKQGANKTATCSLFSSCK